VRLNIEPGTLRVASNNAEQEEAVDELDIDYGGDAIEIGFNVTYLIDALANMDQDMVKLELADSQQLGAGHHPRERELQVRRDADAHLSSTRPPALANACRARPGIHPGFGAKSGIAGQSPQ
jgi:hypothetical protein